MIFIAASCVIMPIIIFIISLKEDYNKITLITTIILSLVCGIVSICTSLTLKVLTVSDNENYIKTVSSVERIYPISEEKTDIYLINRLDTKECLYLSDKSELKFLNKEKQIIDIIYIDTNSPCQVPCLIKYNRKYTSTIKNIVLLPPESYYIFYVPRDSVILK